MLESPFLLPQRTNNEKRECSQLQNDLRKRGVIDCMGHSNRTICCLLSQLCSVMLGSPFLTPQSRKGQSLERGILPSSKWKETEVFKLDHLQLVEPILFPNFHKLFTFILGRPILFPQGPGAENVHSSRHADTDYEIAFAF